MNKSSRSPCQCLWFLEALTIITNFIMKGYSDFIILNRVKLQFKQEEIRLLIKLENKVEPNNFFCANLKESIDCLKVDGEKFEIGLQATQMKEINISDGTYLQYFFRNCCKRRKDGDLQEYFKYLDFKHVFEEIIRIKEKLRSEEPIMMNE